MSPLHRACALACVQVALTLGLVTAAGPGAAADCVQVGTGAELARVLARATPGTALCLAPGRYEGPLVLGPAVTLRGPRDAVVVSRGRGTTVTLEGPGAALEGVSVEGSGGRFDLLDAAVRVAADDTRVENVAVRGALFGLLVQQASRVVLRGNEISGHPHKALGLRGDGIRLWEVRGSTIERNRLADSRDLVVWYSPGNRFAHNTVERGRYGAHFMYSHRNVVEDNRFVGNVVGIFVMYSRGLELRRNLLARASGAAGMGLGAKESGGLVVEQNAFLANQVGAYLDTSPLDPANPNRFQGNVFRLSDAGVVFHGVAKGNTFTGNRFADNATPVRVEGRGDARAAQWRGNAFDDYAGYDLNGDGIGDLPYELRTLSGELTGRVPELLLFRGSPAMALVELVGRVVPLFQPQTLLVDPEPRVAPLPAPELGDAG